MVMERSYKAKLPILLHETIAGLCVRSQSDWIATRRTWQDSTENATPRPQIAEGGSKAPALLQQLKGKMTTMLITWILMAGKLQHTVTTHSWHTSADWSPGGNATPARAFAKQTCRPHEA